jgi:hypothetical protein
MAYEIKLYWSGARYFMRANARVPWSLKISRNERHMVRDLIYYGFAPTISRLVRQCTATALWFTHVVRRHQGAGAPKARKPRGISWDARQCWAILIGSMHANFTTGRMFAPIPAFIG